MSTENVLDTLMDIGLASKPHESIIFTDEPKIPNFICTPNKSAQEQFICQDVYGHGSGRTINEAKIKSLGEFYERLCMANPDTLKITNSKYCIDKHIDPRLFVCYSETQFENKREYLNKLVNSKLDWYPVYDIMNKKMTEIPASLIYLYDNFCDDCQVRREQISTGAAFDKKDDANTAFKSGFLESIERDAYITAYLKKRRLVQIHDFSSDIQQLLEYLSRYNLKPHIFDITTDLLVPTFMTITLDETGIGPAVDIGVNSGYNYEDTIYNSIKESIQARTTSRFLKNLKREDNKNIEIKTLEDRYYYWYDSSMIKHLDFWLKDTEKISFYSLPEYSKSFKETMSIMTKSNFHVYVADMSVNKVKEAGFEAVKAIIPELHPLYLDEDAKSLYSIHAGTLLDDKSLRPQPFT